MCAFYATKAAEVAAECEPHNDNPRVLLARPREFEFTISREILEATERAYKTAAEKIEEIMIAYTGGIPAGPPVELLLERLAQDAAATTADPVAGQLQAEADAAENERLRDPHGIDFGDDGKPVSVSPVGNVPISGTFTASPKPEEIEAARAHKIVAMIAQGGCPITSDPDEAGRSRCAWCDAAVSYEPVMPERETFEEMHEVFCPWVDVETWARANGLPVGSPSGGLP